MKPQLTHRITWLALIIGLFFCAPYVLAQSLSVNASFDPPVISVGQSGNFTITFTHTQNPPNLQAPRIDGLLFSDSPSLSRRSSWVNGVSTQEVSLTWRIAPQREGTFVIPARRVQLEGQSLSIPETRLRVVPMSEREARQFRLKWDFPDKPIYVGESVPVLLQLYVLEGIDFRVPALPERIGDGFQITPFSNQVAQERKVIDGDPYLVYSWSVIATPIRAGELPLEATVPVVYVDPQSRRMGPDMFGFPRLSEQQRRLTTGQESIQVLEPPAEGRPTGFNGAIGHFETEVRLGRNEVRAGEPLTLILELSGSGNFERISAPAITEHAGWRVYPPRTTFEAAGERDVRGRKTFEYLLIPESEETAETPRILFAAFDPVLEQYVDLSVEPRPVSVSPAPVQRSPAVVFGGRGEDGSPEIERTWRPNRADFGSVASRGIIPLYYRPIFWILHGTTGFALIGLFAWQQRRHRLEHDEAFARKVVGSRSVRHWTRQAAEAASKGQAEVFYSAAQRSLQESVARCFPRTRKAESLILSEIEEVLAPYPLSQECREAVRNLFQTGDALKYARSSLSKDALQADANRLVSALRELHKSVS